MELISRNAPNYKGLDLNFLPHPVSGDITKLSGVEAVRRSIRNLVMTNFYEKKFRHFVGSGVTQSLFENMNSATMGLLLDRIADCIKNYEKRATLVSIDGQAQPELNGIKINITIKVKNVPDPITFDVFLERIR